MKTNSIAFCTALMVSLVAVPALYAQYPGQFGPAYDQPISGTEQMASPVMQAAPVGTSMVPMVAQPMCQQVPQGYAVVPASYDTLFGDEVGGKKGGGGKGKCGGKCGGQCLSGGYSCRMTFYGEFLYLRVRDAEVAFAVPIDGPITAPPTPRVEVGPVAVADMDFQPGYRAGLAISANDCTQFTAEYSMFESGTTENSSVNAPFVLDSLVQHPSVQNVGADFRLATGQYDISFDMVDVAMHRLLSYSCSHQFGYSLGIRYAQHEQNFQADFSVTGTENVTTDIDFYGVGVRGGLEFEQYVGCRLLVYAKGYGSIMPGEFRASYLQSQSFDARVVSTTWKAGRVMTMWDLELGLGFSSKCKNYRLTTGYVFSAWTNMLQTDEWIRGVHRNDFIGMEDTTTLDGLVARFEARY
ncbi:MAG TPA: Lpg1974 family pore-forming outer membrane protein [Pirellulaceae bacterium]|nr:Lpg1974 family pore-forming outer membrane protein [Pirellulaceae bacterium]